MEMVVEIVVVIAVVVLVVLVVVMVVVVAGGDKAYNKTRGVQGVQGGRSPSVVELEWCFNAKFLI